MNFNPHADYKVADALPTPKLSPEMKPLEGIIIAIKKELEAMQIVETAQANLQETLDHVERIEARLGSEHRKLFEEQDSLEPVRRSLLTEREAATSAVASGILSKYEDLRRQRRGIAVSEVSENACNSCGTTLTAALQQSARHAAELVFCPSCGRILFAG